MLHTRAADIPRVRPTLVARPALAAAIEGLAPAARSRAELWGLMVETFTVDLDALAAILPIDEPEPEPEAEPTWLAARA